MPKLTVGDVERVARATDKPCSRPGTVTFCLLKVRAVCSHDNYLAVEMDGGIKIAATPFHSFRILRAGETVFLPANLLHKGDEMWVDVGMWLADGSMYRSNSRRPQP